ncbi:hypothetical protein GCM10020229_10180 [Kitasatospora albolonga]|uniref:hypothetical protein n=1 Tax=Kitasatospora albolonga TaxID=68173 RepID=UPI0031ECEEB1
MQWRSDGSAAWLIGLALVAATAWDLRRWRRDTGRADAPTQLADAWNPNIARHGRRCRSLEERHP